MSDAYKVWDLSNEDEDDARKVLAYDPSDAVIEYGDLLVREGDCEAVTKHDVRIRNMATGELFEAEVSHGSN